jgi:hypothetical protein
MSRKSFRASRAAAVLAFLAVLRLLAPTPAAADSLRTSPGALDSLTQLMGVVQDLWHNLVNRLTEAPQTPTPGQGGVDAGSADPTDDGGDRGGTIDPNGGGGEG